MRQTMKCAVLWNTVKRWNVMIFKLACVIDERKKRKRKMY